MAKLREDLPSWVVVRVLCGKEIGIEAHLQRRAITTFLPLQRVRRYWSDGPGRPKVEKILQSALFSGYLFAHIFPFETHDLVTTPGVMEIVSLRGDHIEVEPAVIEALKSHVERSADPMPRGAKVEIIDGPYAGWLGEIERSSGEERFMVLLNRITNGQRWHVEASRFDLRAVTA